jgi:hypothetical protein
MAYTERWVASSIIEYFIKNPYGKIKMSTADKNSWLINTNNTVTINKVIYPITFRELGGGLWQATIPDYKPFSFRNYGKEIRRS